MQYLGFALFCIEPGPVKVMRAKPCKVILEKFDPGETKEMVSVLVAV